MNPKFLHWKHKKVPTSWVIRFLEVWNKLKCAWDSSKWTWTSCKVYICRLATMNKCNILELSLSSWLVFKLSLEQENWSSEQMKTQEIRKVDCWRLHFDCRLDCSRPTYLDRLRFVSIVDLVHIFAHSRGQCSVHRFEDFPYTFGVTARDLVQSTNLVIKQSCCIQSTKIVDLNLWVEISKSQTREFVCNNFTIKETIDSGLRVVTTNKYY